MEGGHGEESRRCSEHVSAPHTEGKHVLQTCSNETKHVNILLPEGALCVVFDKVTMNATKTTFFSL